MVRIADYTFTGTNFQEGNLNIKTLDMSGATNLKSIRQAAFAWCSNLTGGLIVEVEEGYAVKRPTDPT